MDLAQLVRNDFSYQDQVAFSTWFVLSPVVRPHRSSSQGLFPTSLVSLSIPGISGPRLADVEGASPVAQTGKNPPAMHETRVRLLG